MTSLGTTIHRFEFSDTIGIKQVRRLLNLSVSAIRCLHDNCYLITEYECNWLR